MSAIKKLAGQTLWYGLPTIISRFLGYIMNLSLPLIFKTPASTADLSQIYAFVPFFNILFTYGLETSYFRFSNEVDKRKLYSTLSISLFTSTILFTGLLWLSRHTLIDLAVVQDSPQFITWMIGIIFFDALCTLAFAKLRQENRPRRFAFARIIGILINILVVVLCMGVIPMYVKSHPHSFLQVITAKNIGIGWYLIGNLCGSVATFLFLTKEIRQVQFQFDGALWKRVMKYAYPLVIVGLGGMVNDVLSRLIYQHVVHLPTDVAKHELAIFANVYRLAVMITIMIQAFRMAAEPFFFNRAKDEDAPRTYARVMKFFVIACCFMFLFIALYIDAVKLFFILIHSNKWVEGLYVVPLLALGNIFLGIYYNLSIWYKLTNQNMKGAYITLTGAAITIVLNIILIPWLHYTGAAIATFCCYLYMMIVSYKMGQKYYPIPYAHKKLIAYIIIVIVLFLLHRLLVYMYAAWWFNFATATLLFSVFFFFIARVEKKEFARIPILNRFT